MKESVMGNSSKYLAIGFAIMLLVGNWLIRINFYFGVAAIAVGLMMLCMAMIGRFRHLLLWGLKVRAGKEVQCEPAVHTTQVTSAEHPYTIHNPLLGFLNLAGEVGNTLARRDLAELSSEFSKSSDIKTDKIPKCNVLFVYCALESSGRIAGQEFSLRDLIKAAGAHIAVVASENSPEVISTTEFNSFLQSKDTWPANIIITLNRNDDAFGRFFKSIFALMHEGATMPMAWVSLAPQVPLGSTDTPSTVALLEVGHIVFRNL